MYVIVAFDTEDIYYPPEYGIDDIPAWLAEIMTQCGIRGTFYVMGEKARSMKERGRTDVLKKMAKHDIGSHQRGNCRPLLPQVVEKLEWQQGVEAVREYEDSAKNDIVDAFGKEPVGFSRHNAYFAPQHVAVAGERGLSYMYLVSRINDCNQPVWYANAVCFPSGPCEFSGFDTLYSQDDAFEGKLEELQAFIGNALEEKHEYAVVFACHPVRVRSRGWLEKYVLASGKSRTPQEVGWLYGVKTTEQEERAKKNFRRLCEFLRDHPALEVVGIEKARELFATQPANVTRDALTVYARRLEGARRPILHSTFSPAEMTVGLAESILYQDEHGDVPDSITRSSVMGPQERPAVGVEQDKVSHEDVMRMCKDLMGHVRKQGSLPANLMCGENRVGIGQFALVAARSYLALGNDEKRQSLRIAQTPRYPDVAFEFDNWVRQALGEHWGLPLDFDCSRLAEHARLQTWTMKPAWLKPPLGPALDGLRAYGSGGNPSVKT